MRRSHRVAREVGLALLVAAGMMGPLRPAGAQDAPAARPVAPRLAAPTDAELVVGEQHVRPVPSPASGALIDVGELTLQIDAAGITARKGPDAVWRVEAGERGFLQVVGVGAGVAWVQRWRSEQWPDKSGWHSVRVAPATVERLALTNGAWLAPATVPVDSDPAEHTSHTVGCCVDGDVAVLLSSIQPKETEKELFPDPIRWRVTRFDGEKPGWSRTFPVAAGIPGPSALLIGGADSSRMSPGLTPLVRMADRVLVAAGPREPLRALKIDSGADAWTLSHLWEFARGYIGPSVYEYFVGRFGDHRLEWKKQLTPEQEARRTALAAQCWLAAGPVVVPYEGDLRIFVAVVQSAPGAPAHVHDCRVYELDGEGRPVALVAVPRPVDGDVFTPAPPGFVWGCSGGALARFEPSRQFGMIMRGSDHIARLAWYRHFTFARPSFWMSVPNGGVTVGVDAGRAVAAGPDCYVFEQNGKVVEVPLLGLDLERNRETRGALRLTLTAPPTIPAQNCMTSRGGDGTITRAECFGYHLCCVAGVEMRGEHVRITAHRMEGGATAYLFPAAALFPRE